MKRARRPSWPPPGAGAAKAKAVNEDIKRSTATLVEEMQRKTGDSR